MKKVLVWAGLAVSLAGCGPSPEDVCQKTFDLLKPAVGDAKANKAIGGDMKTCVEKETSRKDMQGIFKYKKNNECLMSAKTVADAEACSK